MSTKRIKVYMGIPSLGTRSDLQCYALREIERNFSDRVELVYPKQCTHRVFHDFARNAIVEEFLESDCDILWFLDADVVPPTGILEMVVNPQQPWELAGAPYPIWMAARENAPQQIVFTCYVKENGKLRISDVPRNQGRALVDGLATGCLFIKREVFQNPELKKPYFEFKYRAEDCMMYEGEDLGFCNKVNDLDYKFYVDFAYTCSHFKTVNLLDMNNYAMDLSNSAVVSYDAQIRPQVKALESKIRELAKNQKPKSTLILPDHLK